MPQGQAVACRQDSSVQLRGAFPPKHGAIGVFVFAALLRRRLALRPPTRAEKLGPGPCLPKPDNRTFAPIAETNNPANPVTSARDVLKMQGVRFGKNSGGRFTIRSHQDVYSRRRSKFDERVACQSPE